MNFAFIYTSMRSAGKNLPHSPLLPVVFYELSDYIYLPTNSYIPSFPIFLPKIIFLCSFRRPSCFTLLSLKSIFYSTIFHLFYLCVFSFLFFLTIGSNSSFIYSSFLLQSYSFLSQLFHVSSFSSAVFILFPLTQVTSVFFFHNSNLTLSASFANFLPPFFPFVYLNSFIFS